MLSISEIIKATKGNLINGNLNDVIEKYCIDSREINKDDFFVPFVGKNVDAQDFIVDNLNNIKGFFIQINKENKSDIISKSINVNKNINIVEVENTEKAFYDIAKYNREKHINIPIIAVTGSVGKTSTKEMISSVLSTEKNILKTEKNYNSYIGLSYMMLKLENQDVAILEHGIDRFGEMDELIKLSKPNYSVVTLIGTSHIEAFKTRENIFLEKTKVIKNIELTSVVNGDDEYLCNLDNVIKYSLNQVKNIKYTEYGIEFETTIYNKKEKVKINELGNHNIYNALAAIKIAELLKIKANNILKGIAKYKNYSRRFEKIKIKDTLIIDDTYNASLDSMISGIKTLNNIKINKKIVVLGDMLELGDSSIELHKKVGEIFKYVEIDKLFLFGEKSKFIYETAKKYVESKLFNSREELLMELKNNIKNDTVIYFKASNGMKFNEIIEKLK